MLDTNIFNLLAKGRLTEADLPRGRYVATHVQRDELEATPDDVLRARLLSMFDTTPIDRVATSSFVLGLSRLNAARLNVDDSKFSAMLARLIELDRAAGKRLSEDNQRRDVLIAETAIANGLTLLTNDDNLETLTREFGGSARRP